MSAYTPIVRDEDLPPGLLERAARGQATRDFAHRCKHHVPKPGQAEKYTANRALIEATGTALIDNCPPGRELAIALTKLDEALMFANAAIARS